MMIQQTTVIYLVIKCGTSTQFSGILHHIFATGFASKLLCTTSCGSTISNSDNSCTCYHLVHIKATYMNRIITGQNR